MAFQVVKAVARTGPGWLAMVFSGLALVGAAAVVQAADGTDGGPIFGASALVTGADLHCLLGVPSERVGLVACRNECEPIPWQLDERGSDGQLALESGPLPNPDDPPGVIDENDEVRWMVEDAGRAMRPQERPAGVRCGVEIRLAERETRYRGYLYAFVWPGLAPRSARSYVRYDSERDVITGFSGILQNNSRAAGGDFFVGPSAQAPGVIHVLVGAPGLTAAPGIADLVIKMLTDLGMQAEEKKDFQKKRMGWPRFEPASLEEKQDMVSSDSKYGNIVCRCEHVTEAEIVEAIRRGADTMDGVKHLTRAGMGRCQGGFCGIRVLNQLAGQLGISATQVTKKGEGSHHVVGFTKQRATSKMGPFPVASS